MSQRIEGEGPTTCLMAIIGEAPGETEEVLGKPFVGASGQLLNQKLHNAGIARQECYVTNLVKTRPKGNDFSVFWRGTHPTSELLLAREELLKELDSLQTNVFFALGANALWALTGKTQIGKWRGSILSCLLPSGRVAKVIATYHPAAALRDYTLSHVIGTDVERAKNDSTFPELNIPVRNLIISPTYEDVICFIGAGQDKPDVSFDIETTPSSISCIALSYDPMIAMSIPTSKTYWGSYTRLKQVLDMVNFALANSAHKVGQNITYDIQYLTRFFHILPKQPWDDTLIMQHSCYPELKKSLAFLVSVYTRQPYYKDDLKMWQSEGGTENEKLWRYNAMDAAVTLEVAQALRKEMADLNVTHTYTYMMELLEPAIFMMMRGIKKDLLAADAHKVIFDEKIRLAEIEYEKHFSGTNINSPKQMKELIVKLGYKVPTRKGKETTDKKAIAKLALKSPEFASITVLKENRKLVRDYLEIQQDRIDGRVKCNLDITGADTGRISSSESVFNCGNNLQNQPKIIRDIYVPDEGKVFTAADLRGAEARVVAYESEDILAIQIFEKGESIHKHTARLVWDMTDEEIDLEKLVAKARGVMSVYDKGKRLRHSLSYMGSFMTVAEQLQCPAAEAKEVMQKFYDRNPQITQWHKKIENELQRSRTIISPAGRKRIFMDRWGEKMLRTAVAFGPQDTVSWVIGQIIIKFYNTVCSRPEHTDIDILLQIHDEVLIQHPPEKTQFVNSMLKSISKSIKLKAHGREYFIPLEIKTGPNWRDVK